MASGGHRQHVPVAGRRYMIVCGTYRGRMMLLHRLMGEIKSNHNPPMEGVLCDAWGQPTDINIRISMTDVEA